MNTEIKPYTVALADDHVLLRTALANLIDDFETCKVIFQASTGQELVRMIQTGNKPDVVLMDLNMPELDGYEATKWLQQHYPAVNVLMLTLYDSEETMIRLLKAGVKGFLKKDISPKELRFAIETVMQSDYYYTNNTTGKLINLYSKSKENASLLRATISESEMLLLKHACTDLTYKEIAVLMRIHPRKVDNMRDKLFSKLGVKSRTGLVMYAIKHGIVTF